MATIPCRLILLSVLLDVSLLLGGCGGGGSPASSDLTEIPANGPWDAGVELPSEPQTGGDPARGRDLLLHGSYMTCGVPYKLWNDSSLGLAPLIAGGFGGSADAPRIPDREGLNADMPYFLNTFQTDDGVQVINATAPYLHNGSVPTIELMLNSHARPRYWRRVDLDSTHFDADALGWPYIALDTPQAAAPESERRFIYDTTYWSQSNAGHTFGDHLTPTQRRAVLEYLKTF